MSTRRAATLIELMVVIAVMGVMVALLLPAVQMARETSRANGCRNNLRQIGIGLLNYESLHGSFPTGAEGCFDKKVYPVTTFGVSWWADTLPHLEEEVVANQLERTGVHPGWTALNTHNGKAADGFGPGFWFCPSSAVDRFVKQGQFQIAAPSYSGISGAINDDGFHENRVNAHINDGQISGGGVLIPNAVIRSRQITDGLAKTLLVGEQSDFAYSTTGLRCKVGAAFLKGWLTGTITLTTPPNFTDSLAPVHNLATVRYRLNEHNFDLPGVSLDIGANNPLLSSHMGMVNLLYCDGSVHGTSDSLAVEVLKSLATRDDATDTNL